VSVLRVAMVCPLPMPYLFPVMRQIARSDGVELTVLYARRSLPGRGDAPEPDELGFPHRFLRDAGHVFVGREVRELDLSPDLPRELGRLDPDVVVVSGYVQPTSLLGIGWAQARRRPYGLLVESHELRTRNRVRRALRQGLAGPLVRRAAVLFPTGDAAADALAALGAARTRMAPFPHVPDPEIFHDRGREQAREELCRELRIPRESPVVVFVGRLVESKGVATLLEAHADVHRRTGARLVVVGTGPLRESLEAGDAPGVSFLGRLEPRAVGGMLRAADVAVSPSLDEPWGAFPLEAAASGCAIVATDRVPSAVELATRNRAARLVPPGDADALAAAIVELHAAPERLAELARRAKEAAARFTPERAASAFVRGVRLAAS
jgi:glycosyltransferase involved in cell wall biosynthesis